MPLQVQAILVQSHTMICEWGSVINTQGKGCGRPTLYFRQYAENHDKPWWGQQATGPKCCPKFSEYKRDNLLNTKQSFTHIWYHPYIQAHVLHLICSKIHAVYDKWCFGIQNAYNTGNYLYIKCRIFMSPSPCNETHFHSQSHLHNTVCITWI